jgi:hypothetical protein
MKACDECQILEDMVLPPQYSCMECFKIMEQELTSLKKLVREMKVGLEYYGSEMVYTLDSYEGISGEMRSRVVLYGDSEERNDVYSYAGRRARKILKDNAEILGRIE